VIDGSQNSGTRVLVRPGFHVEMTIGPRDRQDESCVIDLTAIIAIAGSFSVQIDGRTHELRSPAIAVVSPGTSLGIARADGGELLVVTLKAALLIECAARLGSDEWGSVVFDDRVAGLVGALELSARRLALAVAAATREREGAFDLAVHSLATDLVDTFGRVERSSRLETSRVGVVDRRLRRSIEFMHDNFDRDIPLGEIAAAAFLSEYHFSRLFKRITGQTPHAYLASLRIEKAKVLLAEADLSIAEVGLRVGYQSASHFGKVFRQTTGITPSAFRDAVVR
jgi:AraC family transcriptional regulator